MRADFARQAEGGMLLWRDQHVAQMEGNIEVFESIHGAHLNDGGLVRSQRNEFTKAGEGVTGIVLQLKCGVGIVPNFEFQHGGVLEVEGAFNADARFQQGPDMFLPTDQ